MKSSIGYKYMMVDYDFDSNNILEEPLKYLTGLHIKNTYQRIQNIFCSRGLEPLMHVLDNEWYQHLKDNMLKENEGF